MVFGIILDLDANDTSNTKVSVNADLQAGKLANMAGGFVKCRIKRGLAKTIEEFENYSFPR